METRREETTAAADPHEVEEQEEEDQEEDQEEEDQEEEDQEDDEQEEDQQEETEQVKENEVSGDESDHSDTTLSTSSHREDTGNKSQRQTTLSAKKDAVRLQQPEHQQEDAEEELEMDVEEEERVQQVVVKQEQAQDSEQELDQLHTHDQRLDVNAGAKKVPSDGKSITRVAETSMQPPVAEPAPEPVATATTATPESNTQPMDTTTTTTTTTTSFTKASDDSNDNKDKPAKTSRHYSYKRRQRYLQEDDRVRIIRRIEAGEKQSELAKEYQVTRAAICNTFKNRHDILRRCSMLMSTSSRKHLQLANPPVQRTSTQQPAPAPAQRSSSSPEVMRPPPPKPYARARDQDHAMYDDRERERRHHPQYEYDQPRQYQHQPPERNAQESYMRPRVDSMPERIARERDRRMNASHMSRPNPQQEDHVMEEIESTMVKEIRTPSMVYLVTALRDRELSHRLFRLTANRVIRLLLEESLSLMPMVRTAVVTPSGLPAHGLMNQYEICAVGIGRSSYPLMENFQIIMPNARSGLIELQQRPDPSSFSSDSGQTTQISLPVRIEQCCVLLLDTICATGDSVVEAIDVLVNAGCHQENIQFVCIIASAEGVAHISSRFPKVKLLVAALDPEVDEQQRILPGCGEFDSRYWGMDQNLSHTRYNQS